LFRQQINMIKTFGIDYGQSKIGIAVGIGTLAEPLKVVRVSSFADALEKIEKEVELMKPDKVVVGVSEGEMGKESLEFSLSLGKVLEIPVETYDETLSTQDAQQLSRQAGIRQKRAKEMEDAYAASIMLQNYLDST